MPRNLTNTGTSLKRTNYAKKVDESNGRPAVIDWDQAITRDLVLAVNFDHKITYDYVERRILNIENGVTFGNDENGCYAQANGIDDRIEVKASVIGSDRLSGNVSRSLSAYALVDSGAAATHANNFPRIIDKSDGGGQTNGWGLYLDYVTIATAQFAFLIDLTPATRLLFGPGGGGVVDNTVYGVGFSATTGSTSRGYIDGADGTVSSGTAIAFPTAATKCSMLNWNHTTAREFRTPVYCVYVWARDLSSDEHRQIHQNPRMIFKYR